VYGVIGYSVVKLNQLNASIGTDSNLSDSVFNMESSGLVTQGLKVADTKTVQGIPKIVGRAPLRLNRGAPGQRLLLLEFSSFSFLKALWANHLRFASPV